MGACETPLVLLHARVRDFLQQGLHVKNNEILVVLDESVSSVNRELAGNGGKSENIDGTDVSENGSTDVVEEGLQGLD